MRLPAALLLLVATLVPAAIPPCFGDEPAAPKEPEPIVGVVTGDKVNLRVGPRIDDQPITQLEQGTILLIVEKVDEWLGVRVPAGFQAAVAAALTEVVDADHVRITGTNVNLRVRPPQGDRAYPAFRDHPEKGAVLPVIAREADWIWVEAPESIRAFIAARFVKELGPLAEHGARVDEARGIRASREKTRSEDRKKATAVAAEDALAAEVGAVSAALSRLRAEGGYDKLPVVTLADRLSSAMDAHPAATERTKSLAKALSEDLEREIELRVAYSDELLARARTGRPPPDAPPLPAPRADAVEATGLLRFEAAKDADGGGNWVLWEGEKPSKVVRYAKGDLKDLDGVEVKVTGKAPGTRLLGLPVIEAESVSRVGR